MKIETKFDPLQYVFFVNEYFDENGNELKEILMGYVSRISINEFREIYYWVNGYTFTEDKLFATKKEAEKKLEGIQNDNT